MQNRDRRPSAALSLVGASLALAIPSLSIRAQTAPVTGIRAPVSELHVFSGARIVVGPGRVLENARLVVRGTRIEAVGPDAAIPEGANVIDARGLEIWPGWIEPWLATDAKRARREAPETEEHTHAHSVHHHETAVADDPDAHGRAHWNPRIHPEHLAIDEGMPDAKTRVVLRSQGFTVARVVPSSGILRGRAAVVTLADPAVPSEPDAPRDHGVEVLRAKDVHCAALERARGRGNYPNSLMGVIALIRQTMYDARWYDEAVRAYRERPTERGRPAADAALASLIDVARGRAPLAFEVTSDQDALRVLRLAREFDLDVQLRGSGHEYRQARAFLGVPLIVPIVEPERPRVRTRAEVAETSLRELLHFEHARQNAGRLAAIGVEFSLTCSLLEKRASFRKELAKAIAAGLDPEVALAALTTTPASQLGLADRLGTIERSKIANFVVSRGSIFDPDAVILQTWIEGKAHDVAPSAPIEVTGRWRLEITLDGRASPASYELIVADEKPDAREEGEAVPGPTQDAKLQVRVQRVEPTGGDPGTRDAGTDTAAADTADGADRAAIKGAVVVARREASRVEFVLDGEKLELGEGLLRLRGRGEGARLTGSVHREHSSEGQAGHWSAVRTSPKVEDEKAAPEAARGQGPDKVELERVIARPQGAYARARPPAQQDLLIRGATIWTSSEAGRFDGDLWVRNGKIEAIGRSVEVPSETRVVDARGKHVTPGLIDAHSHTALSGGTNESTQAVTAEVRIEDIINPDDINIYRQLAGGLTCAHLLHGSANPIGGQSAVVKLRWGSGADEMRFAGSQPGIKFALGENVKQSNRGRDSVTRYPQTRLGVEQILRDRFAAAREYAEMLAAGVDERGLPVRRDLELDALVEVLEGKRSVHCHSYRQDEILMLLRVAEDFGFRVGTLQHVLEGYKVAGAIAKHGAYASTFSDWWAYKVEVVDAIPYNGAIMHRQGVLTTFNSDSSELARRMNVEAAKAVKYGGLDRSTALRFVTLHAAKQLGIDDRVGSLEVGKDADFVIWSGDPLSTLTRCEQTYVDGRRYFDLDEDARMRAMAEEEHARLVTKLLMTPDDDSKSTKAKESK